MEPILLARGKRHVKNNLKIRDEKRMKKEKKMENSNTKNIVSVEVLDKVFPHIAGYDEIRREAYQIVDIFKNPGLYKERGGHCPKGWLLYGVPGNQLF